MVFSLLNQRVTNSFFFVRSIMLYLHGFSKPNNKDNGKKPGDSGVACKGKND